VNNGELASEAAREHPANNASQQDIGAGIRETTTCGHLSNRIKTFIVTFFWPRRLLSVSKIFDSEGPHFSLARVLRKQPMILD
jgi:hypothetical protein